MKTAASVLSWLVGILTTGLEFFILLRGIGVVRTLYDYYGGHRGYYTEIERFAYPGWVWGIWLVLVIIRVAVLIWRQIAVEDGKKIACGICTIIFASAIGGILTLCIPNDQLLGNYNSYNSLNYPSPNNSRKKYLTEQEKDEAIRANRALLDKGIITKEEYEQRIEELNSSQK